MISYVIGDEIYQSLRERELTRVMIEGEVVSSDMISERRRSNENCIEERNKKP